jgi:hypothetical protein
MPVQLAEGVTIILSAEKSFRNLRPTALASSQKPALNAGCPQQGYSSRYSPLSPALLWYEKQYQEKAGRQNTEQITQHSSAGH